MKHLTSASGIRLIILALGIGSLAVLALMFWAGQPASASRLDSAPQVSLAMPPGGVLASQYVSGISCTLFITTEQDFTYQDTSTTFANAASFPALSTYNYELALSYGDVPSNSLKFPVFDEYFRLDNAVVGASYKVDAVPDYTSNYNLGLIIYNVGFKPIMTDTNQADNNSASLTLVPDSVGPYYFKIVQLTPACAGRTYTLRVTYTGPTATPTSTPTATGSPTPTPTATPSWTLPDQYDSSTYAPTYNDSLAHAVALGASTTTGLTLYNAVLYPSDPGNDQDWYIVYGSVGYQYAVSAAPDTGFVYPYMVMEIFGPDKVTLVGQVTGSNNPSISWTASSTGSYYVHIARSSGSPTNGTYHVTWTSNAPTLTPTPTGWTPGPTDTPVPGLDAFEPNWDFDHAAGIGLNVKYTNINFVPLPGQTVNNDYFRVRVKTGMLVTCETLDLSAGTDTNMILYDDNRQGLAGNDDVDRARGELRSRVTVSINYDGFLYILVGQGYAVPNSQSAQYTYSLQCTVGAGQVTATPTPPPGATTAPPASVSTPTPPVPTQAPPPTPSPATAMPPISVRALPTPIPAGPVQQMVTADLQVYYDANDNGVADPGEGVVGLPARVYDATTGALLAQGFTNDTGHAVFSVPAAGSVRVVVPYLGFEATVPPSGAAIPVLISPRELPKQIP
jgi:hypothetical protein